MKSKWTTHDWTTGQLNALVKLLGEKNALRLLRGELKLKVSEDGATAELAKAALKLFDKNGRRIPPRDMSAAVCNPNRKFHLIQPKLDYAERHRRYFELFGDPGMIADEFYARSEALMAKLKADESLVNLLKGVHLPVILPQLPESFDYGELLEKRFLSAVAKAYVSEFSDREFVHHRQGELVSKVEIVHSSHERLVAELRVGPRVALFFPNPLQSFSIHADREQMATLPGSLHLGGGIDTAVIMALYPDVLARDYTTPGLNMAALSWQFVDSSLYFEASDDDLNFDSRVNLDGVDGLCSSGLLLLG
ncbi:MAG: hypothetical protein PHW53_04355 [Patescibacteria group bacterium]|nr:hypothetical protein [Patescibacteria group bacterium]